jgi:FMN phosphatase YigB (HAD superfamily)
MTIENYVLDFDGTLTDVDQEAKPFLEKWQELFAESVDLPQDEIANHAAEIRESILKDPKAGWTYNGLVIAPATADPYVLNTTVYQKLVEERLDEHILQLGVNVDMQDLFKKCYPYAGVAFKEGAKEFLEELVKGHKTVIVTNSDAAKVAEKLAKLTDLKIEVLGNAKKYAAVISPDGKIPESIQPNGFPRPVYLRRNSYKAVLDSLKERGFHPHNTAVVGDIYELDLALPEWLGYHVILMETKWTPAHEKNYLATIPNGFLAKSFGEVHDYAR